ncbi:hypothetical protein IWZ01DRAFT_484482 [Phyllosticta capitalensis]
MFLSKQLPRRMRSRCPLPTSRSYNQKRLWKLWDSLGWVLSPDVYIPKVSVLQFLGLTLKGFRRNPFPPPEPSEVPRQIRPWLFSAVESDWIQPENISDQHDVEVETVMPVVLWNLTWFGPKEYDAARSSAAMSLLRDIFGERPRPMAIMLHEVSPWVLMTILEHEWVRRNFQVGFDDTPIQPVGLDVCQFPEFRFPKSFVMMVSSQLRTEHWMLMDDILSVDLPVGCDYGKQNDKKLLRFGMTQLVFEPKIGIKDFQEMEYPWRKMNQVKDEFEKFKEKFDESNGPKARMKRQQGIQNHMKTGYRPQGRIVASVLGCDIADSGVKRSGYRWTKTGAASMPRETQERIDRLVQFRTSGVEKTELPELGARFIKHGINGKVDLGCMPEGKSPEVAADRDWIVDSVTMKSTLAKNLLQPYLEQRLGWPRNRVQSNDASHFKRMLRRLGSKMKAEDMEEELGYFDLKCPSFAPLCTNDPRFNYDLVEGRRILMWVSDDFGIAMGIKV